MNAVLVGGAAAGLGATSPASRIESISRRVVFAIGGRPVPSALGWAASLGVGIAGDHGGTWLDGRGDVVVARGVAWVDLGADGWQFRLGAALALETLGRFEDLRPDDGAAVVAMLNGWGWPPATCTPFARWPGGRRECVAMAVEPI